MMNEALVQETIDRGDQDSIHTLPLVALPIQHPGLRRTRLVKNVRLESRIEMFSGKSVGSGQIVIEEVPEHFQGGQELRADMKMLSGLATLPSFDCYTLRRGFRQLDIDVAEDSVFRLSDNKTQELFPFMRRITRPLIKHLYGDEDLNVSDTRTLLQLVRTPDHDKVRTRLDSLADTLGVPLPKLPEYLEGFGDLFLSASYFESFFVENSPKLEQMLLWIDDFAQNSHMRNDPVAQKTFTQVERRLRYLKENLDLRFKHLALVTQMDWEHLNLAAFRNAQRGILSHQVYLATGLCALAVKIYEWERRFPNAGGSPDRCLEFVSTDLRPGLDDLVRSLPKVEPPKSVPMHKSGRVWG